MSAIRFNIAAEYETIQVYQQLAESTDNKLAQEVLQDIATEEKEHAGEFLRFCYFMEVAGNSPWPHPDE